MRAENSGANKPISSGATVPRVHGLRQGEEKRALPDWFTWQLLHLYGSGHRATRVDSVELTVLGEEKTKNSVNVKHWGRRTRLRGPIPRRSSREAAVERRPLSAVVSTAVGDP